MLYNEVNQLYVYMYPLPPSHRSRSLQSTKLSSSVIQTAGSHWQAVSHIVVYIYINPKLPIHPTFSFSPLCPHICSLCLCLYSCLGKRFICTIFFFFFRLHLYVLIHDICFSDLLHCMTNSRPIRPLGMRGIEGIDCRQD